MLKFNRYVLLISLSHACPTRFQNVEIFFIPILFRQKGNLIPSQTNLKDFRRSFQRSVSVFKHKYVLFAILLVFILPLNDNGPVAKTQQLYETTKSVVLHERVVCDLSVYIMIFFSIIPVCWLNLSDSMW